MSEKYDELGNKETPIDLWKKEKEARIKYYFNYLVWGPPGRFTTQKHIDDLKAPEPEGWVWPEHIVLAARQCKIQPSPEQLLQKIEEDKYFTPSIEDIRVGYECEVKGVMNDLKGEEIWDRQVIDHLDMDWLRKGIGEPYIRVPYLTKEQIEKEGWDKATGQWWEWPKECDNEWARPYKWRLNWGPGWELENHRILLDFYDNNWFEWFRGYEGPCKDINTLRQIMKLLNIK